MKREYTIIIEAKAAHQPSQDEIFKAVRNLVDIRVKEFPKPKSGTHVSLIPGKLAAHLRTLPKI